MLLIAVDPGYRLSYKSMLSLLFLSSTWQSLHLYNNFHCIFLQLNFSYYHHFIVGNYPTKKKSIFLWLIEISKYL